MADPAFYQKERGSITEATARLDALEKELHQAYERWEMLEELNS